jgi:hypothetical protein
MQFSESDNDSGSNRDQECFREAFTWRGDYQNIVFSLNLCVLFFQTATKLLGPNYLINGSVLVFLLA